MDAIDLLQRYLGQPLKEGAFFDPAESVPLAGVVPEQWRAAAVNDKDRVEHIPYERESVRPVRAGREQPPRSGPSVRAAVPGPRTPQDEAAAAPA
ncbi:hypothetical protein ACFY93_32220 [Streptomyces sp. NPDC008313]|uniref:hypothetical protein n=1 Tax=Streptomyces sp. NPDC008313 TaxID=3364826 RepID=UPI0036EC0ED3